MAVRLLTAKEAAEVLKLGHSKLYLMVRRGELTAIYLNRAGRRAMRFRRSDLDSFMARKCTVTRTVTPDQRNHSVAFDCNKYGMRNPLSL